MERGSEKYCSTIDFLLLELGVTCEWWENTNKVVSDRKMLYSKLKLRSMWKKQTSKTHRPIN